MILWFFKIILWLPCLILHPTFIRGRKNLPKGKAIVCCNHYSNWDIVLYVLQTTEKVGILAKKELFKNKFLIFLLKGVGAISIDRKAGDVSAVRTCMKTLKEDKKLFIFPEGTRLKNKEEVLGEIKGGMSLIAIKAKSPIVPVWIEKKPKLFRKSVYIIGKPFELSEFYDIRLNDETLSRADAIVREKMLEVREQTFVKKRRNVEKESN